MVPQGAEHGIVLCPEVVGHEGIHFGAVSLEAIFKCLPENFPAIFLYFSVVNGLRVVSPVKGLHIVPLQEAVLNEEIQINEIGVARKGRERGIGAVAVTRRPEREHLPVFLAGLLQKVGKMIGLFSQSTDAVL